MSEGSGIQVVDVKNSDGLPIADLSEEISYFRCLGKSQDEASNATVIGVSVTSFSTLSVEDTYLVEDTYGVCFHLPSTETEGDWLNFSEFQSILHLDMERFQPDERRFGGYGDDWGRKVLLENVTADQLNDLKRIAHRLSHGMGTVKPSVDAFNRQYCHRATQRHIDLGPEPLF